MCTLTFVRTPDPGYVVCFNRDERRTRLPGRPPTERATGGVAWLAPTDGDAGGSWIATNEHGLTLALLNGYAFLADPGASAPPGVVSRGRLVTDLAPAADVADVERHLRAADLSVRQPFVLVALDPRDARSFTWDGEALAARELTPADLPVVSSSLDPLGAARARSESWRRALRGAEPTPAFLERFHASHEPERGTLSPCMHRPDARTVSFTRVAVTSREVRMEYAPDSPCRARPEVVRAIARSRAAEGARRRAHGGTRAGR